MADTMDTYNTITPYLVVPDADREITFLEAAFGATVRSCHRGDDGSVVHAEIVVGSSLLMLGQANGPWTPLTAAHYVWVPDVDRVHARALEAGATSQSEPGDQPYGHRMGGVVDANGLTWWIASPIGA